MNLPYPISVLWRDVASESVPDAGGVGDFDTPAAREINRARLDHLSDLELPLQGKSVLDVGGGVGHLAQFFRQVASRVVCVDGRAENIARLKQLYPGLESHVADVERGLSEFGGFDIVFSYGLLYHLANPVLGLRNMAAVCKDFMLLETMVCDHELPVLRLDDETKSFTQALGGLGSRPSPSFVVMALNRLGFPFIYAPKSPPQHPDFQVSWKNSLAWQQNSHPIRCVFIASRKEIASTKIREICYPERAAADTNAVDVLKMQHRVDLRKAVLACKQASIQRTSPLTISTASEQWSYAAAIPLAMESTGERHLAIRIQARVLTGEIGFGVLAPDERSFLAEKVLRFAEQPSAVILPLPPSTKLGNLIVRNTAKKGISSSVVVDEVSIGEAEPVKTGEAEPPAPEQEWTPTQEEILEESKRLCCIRPLFPYPHWRFDADWDNPDAVFRARRKIWNYCRLREWHLPLEMNWYEGLHLCVHLGNDLSRQIFVAGCMDPNELFFLSQILQPGMTFVDAGANEGIYTLLASRHVGAAGRVWAFEPSQRELARLRHNVELNQQSNVDLFPYALAESNGPGSLLVTEPKHAGHSTLGSVIHEGIDIIHREHVELRTLDSLIAEHNETKIDVLKADVEGAELRLFRGAEGVLREQRPYLLFEVSEVSLKHQGASTESLFAFLQSLDYTLYRFSPATGLPVPFKNGAPGDNMVGVPSEKSLSAVLAGTVPLP